MELQSRTQRPDSGRNVAVTQRADADLYRFVFNGGAMARRSQRRCFLFIEAVLFIYLLYGLW